MKKLSVFQALLLLVAVSCSSNNEIDSKRQYTDAELQKIEEMTALYKSYGWVPDSTVSDEERNEMLLKADRDSMEALFKMFAEGAVLESNE